MASFFQPCLLCALWLGRLADGPSGIIPANEERCEGGGVTPEEEEEEGWRGKKF